MNFHRLMIMLCFFDTIYVLLNILLFSLPKIWTTYEASGAHHFVLPKAIPFGKILIDFEGFEWLYKNKIQNTINICTVLMKHIPHFSSNCINGFHLFNTCYYSGTLSHSVPPILCSISSMVIQKIHYSYHDIFFGKWTDRNSLSNKQYYDFTKRHISLNFEAKNIPYKDFAFTLEDW